MQARSSSVLVLALGFAAGLAGAISAHAQESSSDSKEVFLWQLPPFDRMTLVNDEVVDVEPIRIPPGKVFNVEADEYVGKPGLPPFRERVRNLRYRIKRIDDGQEFYVYGRSIKDIQFYEDLLLDEARRLIKENRFDDAHRTLAHLQARDPNWPGLLETRIDDRAREAELQSGRANFERAFWALVEERRLRDELATRSPGARSPDEPVGRPVRQRIENLAQRWLEQVWSEGNFGETRRIVARVESVYPDSMLASTWRGRIADRARQLVQQASELQRAGNPREARATLRRAAGVQPDHAEVRAATIALAKKWPALRVAVERMPTYRHGIALWSPADRRAVELLHRPLERIVSLEDGGVFQSQVIRSIEKGDINRRATLELVEGLAWPGDGKPVTAADLQRLLAECARPGSAVYHPAFSRLLVRMEATFPRTLTLEFDRPQFQPAAWLQIPFLRMSYDPGVSDAAVGTVGFSGLGPFRPADASSREANYLANPRYLEKGRPILQLVTEVRLHSAAARLRALGDANVDLVADLPPRLFEKAAAIPGVRVEKISLPRMHVLQFNLRRREIRNRTLRRAIDFAIDRKAVLAAAKVPLDEEHRLVTGPVPYGSLGYNPGVEPRPFDPQLARLLVFGAKKELGNIPTLRMLHAGDETSRQCCDAIARSLRAIGLNLSIVELDEEIGLSIDAIDIHYQVYTVSDPIYDVVTLLTRDNPSLAAQGTPWLRELVVDLVEAPNLSTAGRVLPELHRVLFEDVAILPLWQWIDRFAVHAAVKGLVEKPSSVYHQVADWTVEPRFPESHWTTRP